MNNSEKKNRFKDTLLIVLISSFCTMTIVYAILSQNLKISSNATVKSATWDVHFENLSSATTNDGAKVITNAKLNSTLINDLDVEFSKAGGYISYTFDIVNSGNIDARISSFKINKVNDGIICTSTSDIDSANVCNDIKYELKYAENTTETQTNTIIASGTDISNNQILKAGQHVKVKMIVSYEGTNIPINEVAVTGLDSTILYEQN